MAVRRPLTLRVAITSSRFVRVDSNRASFLLIGQRLDSGLLYGSVRGMTTANSLTRSITYVVAWQVQWRALDEISAGVCDGMTYGDIKEKMPEEHKARCGRAAFPCYLFLRYH